MAVTREPSDIEQALAAVQAFGAGGASTARIADLETRLQGKRRDKATALLAADHIDETAINGALTIKRLSAQIDVAIHALGILTSLPYVLERGEVIESLSLGAGNTGRQHDLETDRQIAEFKFAQWRGGAEAIRQNNVFIDIFNLASADTEKRRILYLPDKHHAIRFLGNRRAIVASSRRRYAPAPRTRPPDPRNTKAPPERGFPEAGATGVKPAIDTPHRDSALTPVAGSYLGQWLASVGSPPPRPDSPSKHPRTFTP